MTTEKHALTHEERYHLLEEDDAVLRGYFEAAHHPAEIKDILSEAKAQDLPRLFRLIDDLEVRAEVFSELDESQREELLGHLTSAEIATLASKMDSDDAADLIGLLPRAQQHEVLRLLPSLDRQYVQQLLKYPEDSAGGIMQLELARVYQDDTVQDAITKVRELVDSEVEVLAVWVVDRSLKLVGSLELVDLLLNKATTSVGSIMEPVVASVTPLVDQEEVASLFQKYDLMTLPVVDDDDHLLGRIMIDDIVDVLSEEADEDALHMSGISSEEVSHRENILTMARLRLPWLTLALMCSLVSAFLLRFFDPIMQKAVIIVSFLPVVSAMGGNMGIQSATILIRGFASGKIDLSNIPKLLAKEVGTGILMGVLYGIGTGLVATFILSDHNIYLGIVVFIAMVSAMVTAALLGVLAPALLKRLNVDPAIASGPFITTMNDITGILIYFTVASLFLARLHS